MTYLVLTVFFSMLLFSLCPLLVSDLSGQEQKKRKLMSLFIFIAALFIRLIAAALSQGFDNDTACFAAWAERIYSVGLKQFYSPDVFTDYPPGYLYLLYPIGAMRNLFHLEYYSAVHLILLKLPAILCDLGIGFLILRESSRKFHNLAPLLLTIVYLFNPAVLLNSSVWGQVDSVYTLLLLLMCLALKAGRFPLACLCFFPGLLIKPQMLIFAPVLFSGFLDLIIFRNFRPKKLLVSIGWGLISVAFTLLLMLPFGIGNVLSQYFGTVTSYPYAAINACNFWGMLGLNWVSQDTTFLHISYRSYGMTAIILVTIAVLLFGIRHRKNREKYALECSLLMAGVYLFSVRMHERYLYPAIILLLVAIIYKPTKKLYLCYCGFSLLHFINTADVLFFYQPNAYNPKKPVIILVSAGMLILFGFLCYSVREAYRGKNLPASAILFTETGGNKTPFRDRLHETLLGPVAPAGSRPMIRLNRFDLIFILCLTLLYAVIALRDLGDREVPTTVYTAQRGESLELIFDSFDGQLPRQLTCYASLPENIQYRVSAKADPDSAYQSLGTISLGNVYTWNTIELPSMDSLDFRSDALTEAPLFYLKLELLNEQASVLEMHFTDAFGFSMMPDYLEDYSSLFDEQDLVPARSTFRNSMYFDEIYHARTAYEFIQGTPSYENTHPPLGKYLISLGIRLFGMNPFGWRFMGTLFGILMVPLVYLFAKELTAKTSLAMLGCVLYTFDFMHFTQTRLATIDVYISFFVILMYFFMWKYCCKSFYDTPLSKTFLPLGLCGISMGLGVACKWTGVYAGVGLAVIFFAVLLYRRKEYVYVKGSVSAKQAKKLDKTYAKYFKSNLWKTILFCLVFFVVIPALIYLLSYLPFRDYDGNGLFTRMLKNQQSMLSYHSNLSASHPYSSSWYEWPTMVRPIWYYSGIVTGTSGSGGIREGISAFGNPLVWWVGIPAFLYMLYLMIRKRDKTAAFLVIGYLAQYLPWIFITRVTFIYHYFPSVIFVVLMIAYSFSTFQKKLSPSLYKLLLFSYCLAVIMLFVMFYPVLCGKPVDYEYVNHYLRWFQTWVLASS